MRMAESTGIFAYAHWSRGYSIYWIIDLDAGYAELFTDAPDEPACDRGRIISGNLNNGLTVLFRSGCFDWSYQLRLKRKDIPDSIIMQYPNGFSCEFHAVALHRAMALKSRKQVTSVP